MRSGQTKKATASGWIGSALEYYDFFIYLSASSIVFPQLFFPKEDPSVAIVLSLAFWAIGYVARPVGAFFLGHLGDTHGRKNVLLVCLFLMGFSTVGVGLLPTYQQVGVWAPALLVLLRLVQGFAVAGEISGSSCMILEHAPFGRRGFFASFTLQGVQAGQILAAAVFIPLARFMPHDAFFSYGWRIPFLLSVLVIIAGYVIRKEVDETPAFANEAAAGAVPVAPIPEAFRTSLPDMIRVMLMALMNVIPTVAVAFRRRLCGAAGVWDQVRAGHVSLDRGAGECRGGAGDPVRGRSVGPDRAADPDRGGGARVGLAVVCVSVGDQHRQRAVGVRVLVADVGRGLSGLQRGVPELLSGVVRDPGAGDGDVDRAEYRDNDHGVPAGAVRVCGTAGFRAYPAGGGWHRVRGDGGVCVGGAERAGDVPVAGAGSGSSGRGADAGGGIRPAAAQSI